MLATGFMIAFVFVAEYKGRPIGECGLHQGYFEVTKPDPRFFEQIAHIMGVPHEHCVMGDRIDKDVGGLPDAVRELTGRAP